MGAWATSFLSYSDSFYLWLSSLAQPATNIPKPAAFPQEEPQFYGKSRLRMKPLQRARIFTGRRTEERHALMTVNSSCGVLRLTRRLRNPRLRHVFVAPFSGDTHMAQARERQVRGERAQAIGGRAIEDFGPRFYREPRVSIEGEMPVWMRERQHVMMRRIYEVQKLIGAR